MIENTSQSVPQDDAANDLAASTDSALLPSDEFIQLFTQYQRRLYLFVLAQHPTPHDAEEILQNTNVIVLKKFMQFTPGTNFFAWAAQIARLEVLKFRERHQRDKLRFSEDFVSQIADEARQRVEDEAEVQEARRQALTTCLQKLRKRDRELIERRYAPGVQAKELAEVLQRPANSVYQSLSRIRRALWECVQRQLQMEGEGSLP